MSITKGIVSPIFKQNLVSSIVRSILNIDEVPSGFSPLSLFSQGEQGVWYDPSDLTTLFQDAAGTIPVTADGDPVGLMLDKSQGLAIGVELNPTTWTNHSWDTFTPSGVGFTASKDVAGGTDLCYSDQTFAVTSGCFYKITIDVSATTLLDYEVLLSSAQNARSTIAVLSGTGAKVGYVQANVADGAFSVQVKTVSTGDITVSSVSVDEVLGNHATQSVAASRPVYQRGDSRGVVNLLKWSEAIGVVPWSLAATISHTPNYEGQFSRLTHTASSGDGTHQQAAAVPGGTANKTMTISVTVKSLSGESKFRLKNTHGGVADSFSGVLTATDSIQTFSFTVTNSGVDGTGSQLIGIRPTAADDGFDLVVYGFQLEQGFTATPYQRNDSHLGGVATGADTDLHWLVVDGVDDYLALPAYRAANAPADFCAGFHVKTGTFVPLMGFVDAGAQFWVLSQQGNTSDSASLLCSNGTTYIDGVVVDLSQRGFVYNALSPDVAVLTLEGFSTTSANVNTSSRLFDVASIRGASNFYGAVEVVGGFAGARADVETYIATKSGVTLL